MFLLSGLLIQIYFVIVFKFRVEMNKWKETNTIFRITTNRVQTKFWVVWFIINTFREINTKDLLILYRLNIHCLPLKSWQLLLNTEIYGLLQHDDQR